MKLGLPLLQVPLLVALEGVLLLGVGLFLAGLTVHFRDVKDLLATLLTLWFFATPVLYSFADVKSERLRSLLALNPAALLFGAWHDALFFARWIAPDTWGWLVLLAAVTFALGYAFFDRLRDSYPEAV